MKIAFIGGGNMATALIGGLLARGFAAQDINVVEIVPEARERLHGQLGVNVFAAVAAEAVATDVVVVATKPQQLRSVAIELRPLLGAQLVVSIAAGVRTTDMSRWLGGCQRIVRCMPNTPALVGAGITALYAMPGLAEAQKQQAEAILGAVGKTLWVDAESRLDAVTALSGSGPGYVFYFLEALQQAGESLGFTRDDARLLAIETFVGAARLAAESPEDFATLRQRVTSKGGTTEAALGAMEAGQVKTTIVGAVRAADARSRELGDLLGQAD